VRLGVGKSGMASQQGINNLCVLNWKRRGMGQSRTALALILCNLFAYLTTRFTFASLDATHGLAICGDLQIPKLTSP